MRWDCHVLDYPVKGWIIRWRVGLSGEGLDYPVKCLIIRWSVWLSGEVLDYPVKGWIVWWRVWLSGCGLDYPVKCWIVRWRIGLSGEVFDYPVKGWIIRLWSISCPICCTPSQPHWNWEIPHDSKINVTHKIKKMKIRDTIQTTYFNWI